MNSYGLIVLDIMLPGMDGWAVCRELRKRREAVPVLMLTARDSVDDRVRGLEDGADDYLVKPFEPRELVLRLEAILRRARLTIPTPPPAAITMGNLSYDLAREELSKGGAPVRLTAAEASLLTVFARNPGRTLTRDELIRQSRIGGNDRTVDVQITRLRRKIETDPRMPRYLQTVRGEGYVFRPG